MLRVETPIGPFEVNDGVWTGDMPRMVAWLNKQDLGDVDWRRALNAAQLLDGKLASELPPHDDVIVSGRRTAAEWNEDLHPRDEKGQFTESGDALSSIRQDFALDFFMTGDTAITPDRVQAAIVKRFDHQPIPFYHGTSSQAVEDIKANGIKPHGSKGADAWGNAKVGSTAEEYMGFGEAEIASRRASVFVSSDESAAEQFADFARQMNPGSDAVVLKVRIPADELRVDKAADPFLGFQHEGIIPPKWIESIRVIKEPLTKRRVRVVGEDRSAAAVKDCVFYVVFSVSQKSSRTAALHPEREIHTVVDRYAPAVYRMARRAFDAGTQAVNKLLLVRALDNRHEHDAIAATRHASEAVARSLKAAAPALMLKMLQDGGLMGAKTLNELPRRRHAELRTATKNPPSSFNFNPKNPRLAKLAEDHAARLVTDVSATTEQKIRDAITRVFTEEIDTEEAYDEILGAVGDEARAELIERTESMMVVHAGQREAWSDAIDEGYLSPDARRVWIATGDSIVCPLCEELDGKTADLDGTYNGETDGPPLHPNCRCTEGLDV